MKTTLTSLLLLLSFHAAKSSCYEYVYISTASTPITIGLYIERDWGGMGNPYETGACKGSAGVVYDGFNLGVTVYDQTRTNGPCNFGYCQFTVMGSYTIGGSYQGITISYGSSYEPDNAAVYCSSCF